MKRNLLKKEDDNDPMSVVGNLFDVAMVFAVALMVALVARFNMTEMFSKEDFTMVKNPGTEKMEIITKKGEKIENIRLRKMTRPTKVREANVSARLTSSKAAKSSTSPNKLSVNCLGKVKNESRGNPCGCPQ